MEEGETDDDRIFFLRLRPPVVRYRAPVNYGRQLDPSLSVRASHHSPVDSSWYAPYVPLNPPPGAAIISNQTATIQCDW